MSKRSRRRTSTARRRARRSGAHPSAPRSQPDVQQEADLHDEYRYVLADLKRIGALATMMVAVLIGLSLILP
jgi:hypothetical protein